eukprot:2662553-Pleurochrysis_carterae.AAC.1
MSVSLAARVRACAGGAKNLQGQLSDAVSEVQKCETEQKAASQRAKHLAKVRERFVGRQLEGAPPAAWLQRLDDYRLGGFHLCGCCQRFPT